MWRLKDTTEVKRRVQCLAHSQALSIFVSLLLMFQYIVPSFSYYILQSTLKKKKTYWSIVALHWCVSFYCTAKWINSKFTCLTFWGFFFRFRSPQSIEYSSLCYTVNSRELSILNMCVCVSQSCPTLCNPMDCSHLMHSSVYTSILISQIIPSLPLTLILAFLDYLLCPAFFLSISVPCTLTHVQGYSFPPYSGHLA